MLDHSNRSFNIIQVFNFHPRDTEGDQKEEDLPQVFLLTEASLTDQWSDNNQIGLHPHQDLTWAQNRKSHLHTWFYVTQKEKIRKSDISFEVIHEMKGNFFLSINIYEHAYEDKSK